MDTKLKFSRGNAKLGKQIYTFSLPAGHTCPFAEKCLSKAVVKDGKASLIDGKKTEFRCFAASQEVLYKNTRNARWHNFNALKQCKSSEQMSVLILNSLPPKAKYVRVHVSGDFFNKSYFKAWAKVAKSRPTVLFYAYTKSLPFWIQYKNEVPDNLVLTASEGGRKDELIQLNHLRFARVVFSKGEAKEAKLEIDKDDSLAMKQGSSFALLLHGSQPKGTKASQAWQKIKNAGGGYSRKGSK